MDVLFSEPAWGLRNLTSLFGIFVSVPSTQAENGEVLLWTTTLPNLLVVFWGFCSPDPHGPSLRQEGQVSHVCALLCFLDTEAFQPPNQTHTHLFHFCLFFTTQTFAGVMITVAWWGQKSCDMARLARGATGASAAQTRDRKRLKSPTISTIFPPWWGLF